jgi:hypothetical protein
MHPSLIEKPFLSVADLHLIARVVRASEAVGFSEAECDRLDELEDELDTYLSRAVSPDWPTTEVLVP